MVKKIVVLGALGVAMSSSSMAQAPYFKSGFLVGAHVGIANGWGRFRNSLDVNNDALFDTFSQQVSHRGRETVGFFGISSGYRHVFNEGYTVGVEISANFPVENDLERQFNHEVQGLSNPFDHKLSCRFSVIPSIHFGKIMGDRWHIALGLGLGISRFQYRVQFRDDANNPVAKFLTTKSGFVPSISVEYAVATNVSLVGSLSYEFYKKLSKTFDKSLTFPVFQGDDSYTSSIAPRYCTFKIGGIYRF